MKYFTAELWGGINSMPVEYSLGCQDKWDCNITAYRKQLKKLQPYLSKRSYSFFTKKSMHDGYVIKIALGDAIDNPNKIGKTTVVIEVLDFSGQFYELRYKTVHSIRMDTGDQSLFPSEGTLFNEWGYDEITRKKNRFTHDILFSSGATLSIEFEKFSYKRKKH